MLAVIPFFPRIIFHIPLPGGLPLEQLEIHGFGILVALGFLLGGWLAMSRARRQGDDPDQINRLIGWLVVGTFVGGHVGYGLMYDLEGYLTNPVRFLYVWEGLSSIGGFLVCVPLTVYFFHRYKLRLWANLDHMAFGFALGWFFGRMGCTVAHDHPGTGLTADQVSMANPLSWLAKYCRPMETATFAVPEWAAEQPHPPATTMDYRWGPCTSDGQPAFDYFTDLTNNDFSGVVAAHDMGFYEALLSLGILVLFLIMDRRPQIPGVYPLILGVIYGPARMLMDLLRPAATDNRWLTLQGTGIPEALPFWTGVTPGQVGSLLIFGVSLFFLVRRLRSGDQPYWRSKPPPEEGDEGGGGGGERLATAGGPEVGAVDVDEDDDEA